jgi:adenylate kinase family enzyme
MKPLRSESLPRVIFVTGPSGTGKTTVALGLAQCLGYRALSLDEIRNKRNGDTRSAWLEVWRQIKRGRPLVIDATGASRIFRLILRARSYESQRPVVIRLFADTTVLTERAKKRESRGVWPVLLSGGKMVTAEYLMESSTYLNSDLDVDSESLSPKEVLQTVLSYLRHGKQ